MRRRVMPLVILLPPDGSGRSDWPPFILEGDDRHGARDQHRAALSECNADKVAEPLQPLRDPAASSLAGESGACPRFRDERQRSAPGRPDVERVDWPLQFREPEQAVIRTRDAVTRTF